MALDMDTLAGPLVCQCEYPFAYKGFVEGPVVASHAFNLGKTMLIPAEAPVFIDSAHPDKRLSSCLTKANLYQFWSIHATTHNDLYLDLNS